MIKAISIDDEPRAHDVIKHHADKVDELELIQSFTSPIKAASFINQQEVDLIFLDINMPDLDGISLLKTLKKQPMVIFTTAYEEYAVESYDFEALGYLLKPIEFPKFYNAVRRASENMKVDSGSAMRSEDPPVSGSLLLKSGTQTLKIDPHHIEYIEADGNYSILHFEDHTTIVDYSLSDLQEKLPEKNFTRVHRSYTINEQYLEVIESHELILKGKSIPIGKTYRKSIKKQFSADR